MTWPYVLAAYLLLQAGGDLPAVFDETRAGWSCCKVVLLVIVVAAPSLATSEHPNVRAYLTICIFATLTEAPMWGLV